MNILRERINLLFGIDLRALAVLRIALGLMILADLVQRSLQITEHFTDIGTVPRISALSSLTPWDFSLFLMSGNPGFVAVLFALNALFAIGLMLGFKTRWMIVVCWIFEISLQNRTPGMIFGGDILITVLLFWSFFLPVNARFSVDGALNPSPPKNQQYLSFATLAIMLQVLYVYFIGALLKTDPQWWPDGTAVYYTMNSVFAYEWGFAELLRSLPFLHRPLTYFVYFLELLAPIFLFFPIATLRIRLICVALLVLMHLGFLLTMTIGQFPYISFTSLIVFMPKQVWDWFGRRWKTKKRTQLCIYYDEPCSFCKKMCLIIRSLFLWPGTKIVPAQSHEKVGPILKKYNSWVIVPSSGKPAIRTNALSILLKHSPIFFIRWFGHILAIPPIQKLGDKLYYSIANNRGKLGNWSARWLREKPIKLKQSMIGKVVVIFLTILVFYFNIAQTNVSPVRWNHALTPLYFTLQLDQQWTMFAPRPYHAKTWLVHRGTLWDGTVVDARTGQVGEPKPDRPDNIPGTFDSYRSLRMMIGAFQGSPSFIAKTAYSYASGVCNMYNVQRENTGKKRLVLLDIYALSLPTPPPGKPHPTKAEPAPLVRNYFCP